jgi:hypothetical protein
MNTLLELYKTIFSHTSVSDWFFAFLGLLLHAVMKFKTIPVKQFRWRIFFHHFFWVWVIALITITICLGTLPTYLTHYSLLDSALIGYCSSSILRQLFKQKLSNLGIHDN